MFVLLLAFALGLRLWNIGQEPFWLDEACTHEFGAGSWQQVLAAYAADVHPPLYGVLLCLWQAAIGGSEAALRGFSTFWSMLGIAVVVLLVGQMAGNYGAGLFAGLLLAVNPFDIWYAQEARMYAQAACLAIFASWLLWRWFDDQDPANTWRHAALYGVPATLLTYSHYLGAVVLLSQGLFAATLFAANRRKRDFLALVGVGAVTAFSFLPWVLFVHRFRRSLYSSAHVGWIPNASLASVLGYLNHEFFLGFGGNPASYGVDVPVLAAVLLVVIGAAAISTGSQLGESPPRRSSTGLAFLVWLALGPAILAATISAAWNPVYFRPRFALFCLAPALAAFVLLLERVRPPLRTLLGCALATLIMLGATSQAAHPVKEGLRDLSWMAERFGTPEYAFFFPSPNATLVHYYLRGAELSPSIATLGARLRRGDPATVWCCFKEGKFPSQDSDEGRLVAWLATLGPHRTLGNADDFVVYELRARRVTPSSSSASVPRITISRSP